MPAMTHVPSTKDVLEAISAWPSKPCAKQAPLVGLIIPNRIR